MSTAKKKPVKPTARRKAASAAAKAEAMEEIGIAIEWDDEPTRLRRVARRAAADPKGQRLLREYADASDAARVARSRVTRHLGWPDES